MGILVLSKPVLTRTARIIGRRTRVSSSPSMGTNNMGSSTSTAYYVAFEFEGGEREEFRTSGHEYGLMAEGDEGTLVTQGTEIRAFDRSRQTDEIG